MLRVLFLLLIIFLPADYASAQNFAKNKNNLAISAPEKSLKIGEKLAYSLEILGIPVGKITLDTLSLEKINGRDCYHITARIFPNSYFIKFYDIEYKVDTYLDKVTFTTRRFIKMRRYRKNLTTTDIDFSQKQIGLNDLKDLKVNQQAQDILSALYNLRLKDIEENRTYTLDIFYSEKDWNFTFQIGKPQLKAIRKKGILSVFEVVIKSGLNRQILGEEGITVILSADAKRIPLEFKFGTGMGTIKGRFIDTPKNE